ncbi:MAG: glutamine amidotransferase [Chloroflexota bacterium]
MKLGVLNACTPAEEIEFDGSEFESFCHFFDLIDHDLNLIEYRITEGDFPHIDDCDAYLITGSPKGVYDNEPWIAQLADFIHAVRAADTKLVGVCFGHQMLAHTLGGHAEKSHKGWGIGLREIEIAPNQSWMTPPLPSGNFHFCHQDQVIHLPPNAKRLAGNEFCPNGMFVISDRILGLQAHPEITHNAMDRTIEWLEPYVDEAVLQEAASTLEEGRADSVVMAQWVVNFLKSEQDRSRNHAEVALAKP